MLVEHRHLLITAKSDVGQRFLDGKLVHLTAVQTLSSRSFICARVGSSSIHCCLSFKMSHPILFISIQFTPPTVFMKLSLSLSVKIGTKNCASRFTFALKLIIFEWGPVGFCFFLEPNKDLQFVMLLHLFRLGSADAPSILYTGGPVV